MPRYLKTAKAISGKLPLSFGKDKIRAAELKKGIYKGWLRVPKGESPGFVNMMSTALSSPPKRKECNNEAATVVDPSSVLKWFEAEGRNVTKANVLSLSNACLVFSYFSTATVPVSNRFLDSMALQITSGLSMYPVPATPQLLLVSAVSYHTLRGTSAALFEAIYTQMCLMWNRSEDSATLGSSLWVLHKTIGPSAVHGVLATLDPAVLRLSTIERLRFISVMILADAKDTRICSVLVQEGFRNVPPSHHAVLLWAAAKWQDFLLDVVVWAFTDPPSPGDVFASHGAFARALWAYSQVGIRMPKGLLAGAKDAMRGMDAYEPSLAVTVCTSWVRMGHSASDLEAALAVVLSKGNASEKAKTLIAVAKGGAWDQCAGLRTWLEGCEADDVENLTGDEKSGLLWCFGAKFEGQRSSIPKPLRSFVKNMKWVAECNGEDAVRAVWGASRLLLSTQSGYSLAAEHACSTGLSLQAQTSLAWSLSKARCKPPPIFATSCVPPLLTSLIPKKDVLPLAYSHYRLSTLTQPLKDALCKAATRHDLEKTEQTFLQWVWRKRGFT
eukprot:TRINITY_DN20051_c0_g1_i1.p1 TRINITY_DN20051_c0_g1~~TRINITY_DN20051_c0_g1_i1.p1  ORF type:complete len:556 (+),score=125.08 TRINITY_DN20051_c0_g1_i1:106-1773(+)